MATLNNIYHPSAVNKLFLYEALSAGIGLTYQSLVPLALNEVDLLAAVKDALEPYNPPLAAALTIDTQRAILTALGMDMASAVGTINDVLYPTNDPGPAGVWASQTGTQQVNMTFSAPADAAYTHYVVKVGYSFKQMGLLSPDGEALGETVDKQVPGVEGTPEVQVAFVRFDGERWWMSQFRPAQF